MENQEIELHDSIIDNIEQSGADFILHFSYACLHNTGGISGFGPEDQLACEAQIVIIRAVGDFSSVLFPFDIYDGDLVVDGEKFINCIPATLNTSAKIELRLYGNAFEDGEKDFILKGEGCKITLTSAPTLVQDFDL